MESKKINQLATNVAPQTSDLTIIGDPITGVSKKITLLQIANLFATTGTVSSVAITETGNALTITGSPITTAGTINIGFAGAATQYVRGDGALADFPTSTGGGSSVSYYLNSSVSQGTIGGNAYRQLSKTPVIGAGTDITISANGYVANYITDANDPALLEVPGGNFNCEFYFSVNSNNHNPYVYAELYKYDGTTFTLLGSNQAIPDYLSNGTTLSAYYFAIPVATTALTITDRLAIRIYVNVDGRTVTLHTENNHLCQVVTTFSKGLTSLNNLTKQVQFLATGTSGTDFNISSSTATHTFNLPVASATNTGKLSSTDWSTFNNKQPAGNYVTLDTTQTISGLKTFSAASVNIAPTSGDGGILNLKRGAYTGGINDYTSLISQGDNFGIASLTSSSNRSILFDFASITSGILRTYTLPNASGTIALTSQLTGGTVTSVGLSSATSGVTIGSSPITTSGTITLAIATASGSQNGLLSSTDWTTFNNKYNLPSLTSGSVLFSNGTTIAQNNANFFWNNTNSFLGVGTNAPSAVVTAFSTNAATQLKAAGTAPAITFSNTLTSASLACVFGLATANNHFITGTAAGDMAIANQSTSAGAIVFGTGTFEKMRMTSAGTFSIGNTNSTYKLDVTGTGRFTDDLYADAGVFSLGLFTSDETKYVVPAGVSSLLTLNLSGALSGTSATFTANTNGVVLNAATGTTNTQFKVANTSGDNYFGVAASDGSSLFTGTTAYSAYLGTNNARSLHFVTNGIVRQTIDSTGAATFSSTIRSNDTNGFAIGSIAAYRRIQYDSASTKFTLLTDTNSFANLEGATANFRLDQNAYSWTRIENQANNASAYAGLQLGAFGNTWGIAIGSSTANSNSLNFVIDAGGGNTPRMTLTSGGNVGIGTSSPTAIGNYRSLTLDGVDGSIIDLRLNGSANGRVFTASDAAVGLESLSTTLPLVFKTNSGGGSTERMRITSGGNVLIGTTSNPSNYKFVVSSNAWVPHYVAFGINDDGRYIGQGNIISGAFQSYDLTIVNYATSARVVIANGSNGVVLNNGATSWSAFSDERLKNVNGSIENAVEKLLSIRAVKYSWKTDETNKENLGLIAQDVEKVFPQVVDESKSFSETDDTKYLSLRYTELIPVLVKAIQELKLEIEELKNK